jgi:hypothetical protein
MVASVLRLYAQRAGFHAFLVDTAFAENTQGENHHSYVTILLADLTLCGGIWIAIWQDS